MLGPCTWPEEETSDHREWQPDFPNKGGSFSSLKCPKKVAPTLFLLSIERKQGEDDDKDLYSLSHPELRAIDEALFRNDSSFRIISEQFGVTKSALFRHKKHSPITERARKLGAELEKLPPKKAAYVRGRIDGKSKKQAALDAGFSETMAEHAADKIETKDVREIFARFIREMIPPEVVAKAIAEGLVATETKFFSHEGVVQDQREVPDWSERRQYAELAAEYGGYHQPAKDDRGQGGSGPILILSAGVQHTQINLMAIDVPPAAGGIANNSKEDELLNLPDMEEADAQDRN